MTSIPASRSARAIIFAPRSCPSRPGLATSTRILRSSAICLFRGSACTRSVRLCSPFHGIYSVIAWPAVAPARRAQPPLPIVSAARWRRKRCPATAPAQLRPDDSVARQCYTRGQDFGVGQRMEIARDVATPGAERRENLAARLVAAGASACPDLSAYRLLPRHQRRHWPPHRPAAKRAADDDWPSLRQATRHHPDLYSGGWAAGDHRVKLRQSHGATVVSQPPGATRGDRAAQRPSLACPRAADDAGGTCACLGKGAAHLARMVGLR